MESDLEWFDEQVKSHNWIYASTMPETPHEYIRRGSNDTNFIKMVKALRYYGFNARYGGLKPTKYLIRGDWYYWTMGAPIEDTIIINRAQMALYELKNGYWSKRKIKNENIPNEGRTDGNEGTLNPTLF